MYVFVCIVNVSVLRQALLTFREQLMVSAFIQLWHMTAYRATRYKHMRIREGGNGNARYKMFMRERNAALENSQ